MATSPVWRTGSEWSNLPRMVNNNGGLSPPLLWHGEWNVHHPLRSFWICSNLCLPKGFVKVSAQFWLVSTFKICKLPFAIGSWKWWYLRDMCLVWGLKFVSVVASIMQALLSSYTLEGDREDWKAKFFMLSGFDGDRWRKLYFMMSCRNCLKGRISLVAVDKAMHSLSALETRSYLFVPNRRVMYIFIFILFFLNLFVLFFSNKLFFNITHLFGGLIIK